MNQIGNQPLSNLRLRTILIDLSMMTVNPTVDGSNILVQLGKLIVDLIDNKFRRRLENFMLLLKIPL